MTGEFPHQGELGQFEAVPGNQPEPRLDVLREQLAREDRARNPQTPEEWYTHAVESMGAIGEIERSRYGANETQDYRTYAIRVPGGTGLYTDTPQDNYEVRIQRDVPLDEAIEVDEEAFSLEDLIKGVHAKQADTPEFVWRDHRAHVVTVQRNNTETLLSALSPDELEQHSRFLRKVAIFHAAFYERREVLERLLEHEPDIRPETFER